MNKDINGINNQIPDNFHTITKYATVKESITFLIWAIFNYKKYNKVIECINKGMHWKAAFKIAKAMK